MIKVKSSTIEAVSYDEESRRLTIQFKGGRLYHYDDVPLGVYNSLLTAESVGRFFHSSIKGRFKYEKE